MKNLLLIFSFIAISSSTLAQNFKVPERSVEQKYNRASNMTWVFAITSIAMARSNGISLHDHSVAMGDLFKTTWNKENGFVGFVNGCLLNFEDFRKLQHPSIDIIEQAENHIVFKWKMGYKDLFGQGPVFGVTIDDFTTWNEIVYQTIGDYLDASYEQEIIDEDWLKITIQKKQD